MRERLSGRLESEQAWGLWQALHRLADQLCELYGSEFDSFDEWERMQKEEEEKENEAFWSRMSEEYYQNMNKTEDTAGDRVES
jgi:hypothetical protein